MKFCPYCGAEQMDDAAAFCLECGKPLQEKTVRSHTENTDQKHLKENKREKRTFQRTRKVKKLQQEQPEELKDNSYDGYYDDVLPVDLEQISQALDRQLIKKIVALAAGAMLVIIACVAIMYLL